MSKLFGHSSPLGSLLLTRALLNSSALNVISLILLFAAVSYQVRAYRALREYEKVQCG